MAEVKERKTEEANSYMFRRLLASMH